MRRSPSRITSTILLNAFFILKIIQFLENISQRLQNCSKIFYIYSKLIGTLINCLTCLLTNRQTASDCPCYQVCIHIFLYLFSIYTSSFTLIFISFSRHRHKLESYRNTYVLYLCHINVHDLALLISELRQLFAVTCVYAPNELDLNISISIPAQISGHNCQGYTMQIRRKKDIDLCAPQLLESECKQIW